MSTERYTQALLFVDGILAAEEVSCELDEDAGNNVVLTQAKGFAGITPGADQTKLSVTSAIPRAGVEIDYDDRRKKRTPTEFMIARGGKRKQFKGFVMNTKESHGVNKTSELSFEAQGGPCETL